jgi:hypothetical protein
VLVITIPTIITITKKINIPKTRLTTVMTIMTTITTARVITTKGIIVLLEEKNEKDVIGDSR